MNRDILIGLTIAGIVLSTSCKKNTTHDTSCTSTLYGYTTPVSAMYLPDTTCNFGIINESTALFSGLGTFSGCVYSNQAAYSTSDNYYYAFKMGMGAASGGPILYKINTVGTTTALANSSGASYASLTYDGATNSLYGVSAGHLVQITIAATTFSSTDLAMPIHPFAMYNWATADPLTVDNTTGDVYYVTGDTLTYYIEKYHPGTSASSVVASGTGAWDIYGMQFNKNDNMLYAVKENVSGSSYDFIKIDPSTGTISTLTALSMGFNSDFYSTCIDPCSNRYIISTRASIVATNSFSLIQLSMTGSIVQQDTTATMYQGLTAH